MSDGAAAKLLALKIRVKAALVWCGEHDLICALYVLAVMLALAALSAPLGVHSVSFDGRLDLQPPDIVEFVPGQPGRPGQPAKEVGYLLAPNWTFYSVVIVPMMTLFAIRLWRAMPETLKQAAAMGLMRDTALARLDSEAVARRWAAMQRRCVGLFAFLVVCVMAFVGWDWWQVVAHPLIDARVLTGLKLWDPTMEFDWSIACRYPDGPSCLANGVFGAVAYLLIAGAATASAFGSCLAAVLFVGFICGGVAGRSERFLLFAMPCGQTDERGGFEIFGSFFSALFGLSICVVVGCLLMIIQNAYLRDPTYTDVFGFMFHDADVLVRSVRQGQFSDLVQLDWLFWLFEPADRVIANPQTGLGVILMALTVLVATGLSWWLLRQSAREARLRSRDHAEVLAAECGMERRRFMNQLKKMDFWPVGWMKQNQLMILLFALLASVFSYRLLLLPMAWIGVQGGQAIWKLFAGGGSKDDDFNIDDEPAPAPTT